MRHTTTDFMFKAIFVALILMGVIGILREAA